MFYCVRTAPITLLHSGNSSTENMPLREIEIMGSIEDPIVEATGTRAKERISVCNGVNINWQMKDIIVQGDQFKVFKG